VLLYYIITYTLNIYIFNFKIKTNKNTNVAIGKDFEGLIIAAPIFKLVPPKICILIEVLIPSLDCIVM